MPTSIAFPENKEKSLITYILYKYTGQFDTFANKDEFKNVSESSQIGFENTLNLNLDTLKSRIIDLNQLDFNYDLNKLISFLKSH